VANTVYEVKSGRIRKFPGTFDYYLEKKDSCEINIERKKPKVDPHRQQIEEERLKAKEEEKARKAEDKKRKLHNAGVRAEITRLEAKKEKLGVESYAKARSLSNPKFYQDEEMAREYGRRLKEIEKELLSLDAQIKGLESRIL
jgi:ATPase subunit of ABC transporter with duplicated ATPase domains